MVKFTKLVSELGDVDIENEEVQFKNIKHGYNSNLNTGRQRSNQDLIMI